MKSAQALGLALSPLLILCNRHVKQMGTSLPKDERPHEKRPQSCHPSHHPAERPVRETSHRELRPPWIQRTIQLSPAQVAHPRDGKYVLAFGATNFAGWFVTQQKLMDTAVLNLSMRINPPVLGGLPSHFYDFRGFFLEKIFDIRSTSILANHEKCIQQIRGG